MMGTCEDFAVKIFDKKAILEDYVKENLHREGNTLKQMHHPNIIQVCGGDLRAGVLAILTRILTTLSPQRPPKAIRGGGEL